MVSKEWYCYMCGDTCVFRQTIRQTGSFAKELTRCPSNSSGIEARWRDTRKKAEYEFFKFIKENSIIQ